MKVLQRPEVHTASSLGPIQPHMGKTCRRNRSNIAHAKDANSQGVFLFRKKNKGRSDSALWRRCRAVLRHCLLLSAFGATRTGPLWRLREDLSNLVRVRIIGADLKGVLELFLSHCVFVNLFISHAEMVVKVRVLWIFVHGPL